MADFTLIDEGRCIQIAATIDGTHVRLPAEVLQRTLGWELKAQGLCRDEICIPIAGRSDLVNQDGIDLAGLAALIGRPLAIDTGERVAYLGASVAQRATQLTSLAAPDFTLPDINGKPCALSDYRGRKVLLVAYASW